MQKVSRWDGLALPGRLADGLALLGGIFYLYQSWNFAHQQSSFLDEGKYLVPGYFYTTGRSWPFQDFGFWTNQMPLAYLIPGIIQVIFGPGLRTGRYFAIVLGLLMLFGMWITSRRLGGRWWAAATVLILAMNPAVIKMYSVFTTQVLIACMLTWMLALSLGENRPAWQIYLAAGLAGAIPLVRVNLVPVLPLFLTYIYWQNGRRIGIWTIVIGLWVFLFGHAVFWPGILRIWAAWIPVQIAPFLGPWRPPEGQTLWNPNPGLDSRVLSILLGFRFHFVAFVGVAMALFLWPSRQGWKSIVNYRASLFLASLFISLYLLHAWASLGVNTQTFDSLGQNYCTFCLPLYIAFFSNLAILLIVATASSWRWQFSAWKSVVIAVFILALATLMGYSAFDPLGTEMLTWRVPRFWEMYYAREFLPGLIRVRRLMLVQMELEFGFVRRLLPTVAGLLVGISVLLLAAGIRSLLLRRKPGRVFAFGSIALVVFLVVGWLLSPSEVLGSGYQNYDCGGDVIASYEAVGKSLSELIPPGAKIYWRGGMSAVPLVYLPGVEIYPPQINDGYSFRLSGDSQSLFRYGFWNQELAEQWLADADFVLVREPSLSGWLEEAIQDDASFQLILQTPDLEPACTDNNWIFVFQRER